MSHRATRLSKRVEIAKSALPFVGIVERDKAGRPKVLLVPGSEGKRYQVILRRFPNGISAECRCETGIGHIPCKGNSLNETVCRHALTAISKSVSLVGMRVSFCQNEQDAKRLSHVTHGKVYPIVSFQSKGKVWGVVK